MKNSTIIISSIATSIIVGLVFYFIYTMSAKKRHEELIEEIKTSNNG